MHKIVNGEKVELSQEEEALILSEWAANETKRKAADEKAAQRENAKSVLKDKTASIVDRLNAMALIVE